MYYAIGGVCSLLCCEHVCLLALLQEQTTALYAIYYLQPDSSTGVVVWDVLSSI